MTCPYFHFWMITLVNVNGFSPNLVCALILWTSAFRLQMEEVRPFLTKLSARSTSIFYFQDNYLSKFQCIFIKFDMCINIVEIYFGIAHWQISSIFDTVICPRNDNGGVSSFHVLFMEKLRKLPQNFHQVLLLNKSSDLYGNTVNSCHTLLS